MYLKVIVSDLNWQLKKEHLVLENLPYPCYNPPLLLSTCNCSFLVVACYSTFSLPVGDCVPDAGARVQVGPLQGCLSLELDCDSGVLQRHCFALPQWGH